MTVMAVVFQLLYIFFNTNIISLILYILTVIVVITATLALYKGFKLRYF